ncbi:uncharacterized conserved protein, contains ferritin-like DUF455 domain [Nitrosomonas sp. PY1]|uniref:ferritin-like domain-containing protein n=1 Tax=Nitrosomonas sp. PY1 TaxID=1803906 RepID=UPI001FC8E8A8|nr:ferritin-like domain-containing protein [Nitrosomonas sp. PY1]GKS70057.1 uncharacterized conserved protein, contains ferritin-like DUF455 domain [Nitrosomonas sp. PY1]
MKSLFEIAEECLLVSDIQRKIHLTQQAFQLWQNNQLSPDSMLPPRAITQPGLPNKPTLVAPGKVPRRHLGTRTGLIALIHAIAHIEFNAINLAWDAVYRFRGLPKPYYHDWIQIATEEAQHFQLLHQRLLELGSDYGLLPAHNGLWDMAMRTASDPMVRMALVPRVLEARGLDVTPQMIQKLQQVGDKKTATILEVILRDEIGHVAIGSHWFKYFCEQRGLDSEQTFRELLDRYFTGQIVGPFDYQIRMQAGFSLNELNTLQSIAKSKEKPLGTTMT